MLQGNNCWCLPITCNVASLQFIFLVNFMNYWIHTIHFLLILEQGFLGYASQTSIKSAAGLFIMHNRIASALFNSQVMIAECLGFFYLFQMHCIYLATLLFVLCFKCPDCMNTKSSYSAAHVCGLFNPVNSREGENVVRIALSLHFSMHMESVSWHSVLKAFEIYC